MTTERVRIGTAMRKAVLKRGNEKCAYCGRRLDMQHLTIDHYHPLDKNGSNSVDNLLPACKKCNGFKANMTKNEFRLLLRGLIGKKFLTPYEKRLFVWYNLRQYKKQSGFLFYYEQHRVKRNHFNQAEINIGYF